MDLRTIKETGLWASCFLEKNVTGSNISYLIQYGIIKKYYIDGKTLIDILELEKYYNDNYKAQESEWKRQLGNDLNWSLSFSEYKELETTKHIHKLHSYKGKFIPQLVEYFLDQHTDNFKIKPFFKQNDIVLDPFCGSGTTLIQANELNLHSIGIDVSIFNTFLTNTKIKKYDIDDIEFYVDNITKKLKKFRGENNNNNNAVFEKKLSKSLKKFNSEFFSIDFKSKIRNHIINEKKYGNQKAEEFLIEYNKLISKYKIDLIQNNHNSFLDKWFLGCIRKEMEFIKEQISYIKNKNVKNILNLILSRAVRSCRATTHADLGTLKNPTFTTYYCRKHKKICKPLFTISGWWGRYSKDTVKRLIQFDDVRTNTIQKCLFGDSRNIDIIQKLNDCRELEKLVEKNKISGIFSSPPYVGLINYHEQHAYAYDLFGFERNDELEIGALYDGQGKKAKKSYIKGISDVLNNCKRFLKQDYDVFLVANDKYNLYTQIADLSNMKIVNEYKRPVLNRVEKNRSAYSEIIFHLKEKNT